MELTTAMDSEHMPCQLVLINLINHLAVCHVFYDAPQQRNHIVQRAEGVPIQTIFCQSLRNLP